MRQRTRRPSRRVSSRRMPRAASHKVAAGALAARRCRVRTVLRGNQSSSASRIAVWCPRVGLIQHKREAYWFYRFLSVGYDRWVNPLVWTPAMRTRALAAARLDARDLRVLDAGAGTGFTTEGIVAQVDPAGVTMLDQSPHQLARSRSKPALERCERVLGDAEALPFADDAFDRYVSAGSIEYWPDPQRGIAEAYRVTRAGGTAMVIGPVRPANRFARALARAWMLFPPVEDYVRWFEAAGFA